VAQLADGTLRAARLPAPGASLTVAPLPWLLEEPLKDPFKLMRKDEETKRA
jgi:hypothetical protein